MWVRRIANPFRRSHRQWRVFHGDDVLECFITDGEGSSAEIRFDYRGEVYHRFVHATRSDAEREAKEKLRELTLVGWTDRSGPSPALSDVVA